MYEYRDKSLSDFFGSVRQSSILVFRREDGHQIVEMIENSWPEEESLNAFLNAPDMILPGGETTPN